METQWSEAIKIQLDVDHGGIASVGCNKNINKQLIKVQKHQYVPFYCNKTE